MKNNQTPRWKAVIEYRSDNGTIDVTHDFEEIGDLDAFIERGPDWNTIIRCTLTLARKAYAEPMTIEKAATL